MTIAPISDEQIRQARAVDILSYLRLHEPESLRKSKGSNKEYYIAEHDSLKISNGKFYWFSRNIGGCSALDFLIKVRGMGFADAVRHLTDGNSVYITVPPPEPLRPPEQGRPVKPAMPATPFVLPPKGFNNDRVYAYLRGRGIDGDIINRCIDGGILYENKKGDCVFVGYDGDKPRFVCERGTKSDYKRDLLASDKRFSFVMPPKNHESRNLACFESAIDSMSHAGIHKLDGEKWDGYRLSLGGVSPIALMSFLERNPHIINVRLCLDGDIAGRAATERIIKELLNDKRFSHLQITAAHPPLGKDYNDTLQAIVQLNAQKSRSDRRKEAVNFI